MITDLFWSQNLVHMPSVPPCLLVCPSDCFSCCYVIGVASFKNTALAFLKVSFHTFGKPSAYMLNFENSHL